MILKIFLILVKDGKVGINGQQLVGILKNSETFKKLFQTDQLAMQSLNYMNAYMDSYLSTDVKDMKNDVLKEMEGIKNTRQKSKNINYLILLLSMLFKSIIIGKHLIYFIYLN